MNSNYPDFLTETGYGKVEGLCGVNCRHSFAPFIPGVSTPRWSPEELAKYKAEEYTYKDDKGVERTLSAYDATQYQRSLERHIRHYKSAIQIKEAGEVDAGHEKRMLKEYQARIKSFTEQAGLRRNYSRERIAKRD